MTDWSKLKVVDLKAELKKRGLAQNGLKPALVARLTAAENEDGSESEATVQGDAAKPGAAASSTTSPDAISPIQPSTDLASQIPQNEPQDVAPETVTGQEATEVPAQTTSPPAVIEETPIQEEQPTATRETPIPFLDSHHSTLPSAEPKEIIEDKNKRKRRSQSPAPSAIDAAHKRLRQDEEMTGMDEVAPHENTGELAGIGSKKNSVDVGGQAMKEGTDLVESVLEEKDRYEEPEETMAVDVKEGAEADNEPNWKSGQPSEEKERPADSMDVDVKEEHPFLGPTDTSPSRNISRNYKELFTAPAIPSLDSSTSRDQVDTMETELPDRIITPARHPATSALYIRNFMRPLNPGQLKKYIADLAAPPGRESDPDVITYFFLDLIRTHAFISFANVAAASRVRSSIHDRIWPDERTRKPLWADFVPAEKVEIWSEEEQAAGGGRSSAKKWEVNYEEDEDRNVTAHLQEITTFPGPRPQLVRQPSIPVPPPQAPSQPRGIENAPSGPRASQNRAPRAMNGFSTLDQLFKSTTAKPLLYWKPVDKAIADKRLDNIESATSREAQGRRVEGELNRYTFEGVDMLVDRGPEIFPGIRPPPGFRGPRGGGGGGGGPPRRGGGYGRPERYDSYRRDNRRDDRRY